MFETVTAPAGEPVTLADAKAHLRLDITDDDTLVEGLIKAARAFVEGYTNRALMTRGLSFTMPYFADEITLPIAPVTEIESIKYIDGDGVEQTLAAENYQTDLIRTPPRIKPAHGESWPLVRAGQYNGVTIQFNAGHAAAADIPGDLRHAVLLMVAHLYELREPVIVAGNIDVEMVPFGIKALMDMHRVYI